MEREHRAKLFNHGGSQAVRLPKEFRFDGNEVRVRRQGAAVILEPVAVRQWSSGFWERMHALGADVDMEVPERLPSSEHRYAIFDEE